MIIQDLQERMTTQLPTVAEEPKRDRVLNGPDQFEMPNLSVPNLALDRVQADAKQGFEQRLVKTPRSPHGRELREGERAYPQYNTAR